MNSYGFFLMECALAEVISKRILLHWTHIPHTIWGNLNKILKDRPDTANVYRIVKGDDADEKKVPEGWVLSKYRY